MAAELAYAALACSARFDRPCPIAVGAPECTGQCKSRLCQFGRVRARDGQDFQRAFQWGNRSSGVSLSDVAGTYPGERIAEAPFVRAQFAFPYRTRALEDLTRVAVPFHLVQNLTVVTELNGQVGMLRANASLEQIHGTSNVLERLLNSA